MPWYLKFKKMKFKDFIIISRFTKTDMRSRKASIRSWSNRNSKEYMKLQFAKMWPLKSRRRLQMPWKNCFSSITKRSKHYSRCKTWEISSTWNGGWQVWICPSSKRLCLIWKHKKLTWTRQKLTSLLIIVIKMRTGSLHSRTWWNVLKNSILITPCWWLRFHSYHKMLTFHPLTFLN